MESVEPWMAATAAAIFLAVLVIAKLVGMAVKAAVLVALVIVGIVALVYVGAVEPPTESTESRASLG